MERIRPRVVDVDGASGASGTLAGLATAHICIITFTQAPMQLPKVGHGVELDGAGSGDAGKLPEVFWQGESGNGAAEQHL